MKLEIIETRTIKGKEYPNVCIVEGEIISIIEWKGAKNIWIQSENNKMAFHTENKIDLKLIF